MSEALAALLVDEPTGDGPLDSVALVLWHGAGGDVTERSLAATSAAAAASGALVVRARFPYRVAGKRAPDRMPTLLASARDALAATGRRPGAAGRRLVLGGRSMGGRVASLLAAETAADAPDPAALVLLSYPLHPAGKPDRLRDEHLPRVRRPMLFVQGDRDALCDLALLRPLLARLEPPPELRVFPGADHGMRRVAPGEIARAVVEFVARVVSRREA